MCGIYGVIIPSNLKTSQSVRQNYSDVFRKLAISNVTRGADATGIFTVNKTGDIAIYKKPVPTWDIVFDENWIETSQFNEDTVALIGHARERSSKTWPNDTVSAHPHDSGGIVGVHNGTITNMDEFYKGLSSDSIGLFKFIEENGIEAVDKLVGSMALCYVKKDNPFVFNFVSYERPLSFIYEKGIFVFSSLVEHLRTIVNPKYRKTSKFRTLLEGNLMEIDSLRGNRKSFKEIPKPKKYASTTSTSVNHNYASYSHTSNEKCDDCRSDIFATKINIHGPDLKKTKSRCTRCKDKCDGCGLSSCYNNQTYNFHKNNYFEFQITKDEGIENVLYCYKCMATFLNLSILSSNNIDAKEFTCSSCKLSFLHENCLFYTKDYQCVCICKKCFDKEIVGSTVLGLELKGSFLELMSNILAIRANTSNAKEVIVPNTQDSSNIKTNIRQLFELETGDAEDEAFAYNC